MYTLATQVHLWTFITSTLAERTRNKWTEKTRQKQSFLNVCCCGKLSRRGKRRKNGMIRNTHIYAKKILCVPVNSLEDKSKVALVIQIKQETRNEYSEPFLILLNATILQQSSSRSWHFFPLIINTHRFTYLATDIGVFHTNTDYSTHTHHLLVNNTKKKNIYTQSKVTYWHFYITILKSVETRKHSQLSVLLFKQMRKYFPKLFFSSLLMNVKQCKP